MSDLKQGKGIHSDRIQSAVYTSDLLRNGKYTEAFDAYVTMADNGILLGKLGLAHCYVNGIGVECSLERAVEIMKDISSGDTFCLLYTAGLLEKSRQFEEAASYYKQAADRGSPIGQYRMGMYQKWGVGVPADIGDSFDHIYMASHGGNAWASRELANIYLQGSLGFIYRIVGLIYVLYIVPFIVISYLIDKKNPRILKMIDPLTLDDPIQMMLRDGW